MSNTKYGKYVLVEPLGKSKHPREIQVPVIRMGMEDQGPIEGWDGLPFSMTLEAIYSPIELGGPHGHTHDDVEILMFMGGNPMDYREFGAEAYILLGEEREKHIINTTTFIYVPGGLRHCPLVFTRVDVPVVFGYIMLAPTYKINLLKED
ncbi:MAG TPA: hypothetical protein GX004_07955 [Firmicutes bacterium]|nr:hypothetical protein [Bacillota bacterium]HHT47202.1 hypothetical protein [Bacillota bacterium]